MRNEIKTRSGKIIGVKVTDKGRATIDIELDGNVKTANIYLYTPKGQSEKISDTLLVGSYNATMQVTVKDLGYDNNDYILSLGTISTGVARVIIEKEAIKEIKKLMKTDPRNVDEKAEAEAVNEWSKAYNNGQRLLANMDERGFGVAAKAKKLWKNLEANYPGAVAKIKADAGAGAKAAQRAYDARTAYSFAARGCD